MAEDSKVQKVARGKAQQEKRLSPCIVCGGQVQHVQLVKLKGGPRMIRMCMSCGLTHEVDN